MLLTRDVSQRQDRSDRVQRARGEVELGVVSLDEIHVRQERARSRELLAGDVDTAVTVAQRQNRRSRTAVSAAELEHGGAVGKTRVEVAQELLRGIALDLPLGVTRSDRVVAVADDLALVQSRSTMPAIAIPKPTHIVAIP